MFANSLKRKNPAKPKEVSAAIRKSFNDAPSAPNLSTILLTTSASTGFFLLTGRLLVLLAHSIMLQQQALSNGLGPSSGVKECSHLSAAWTNTIEAGDLSC